MRKITLLLLLSFFMLGQVATNAQGLFFSEYIEGTSNNKALEIYNPTDAAIDLTGYAFPNVSNAPAVVGEYEYWNSFPAGAVIQPGDVYVIAHSSANPSILAHADMTFDFLSNGDDGFALVMGTEASYTVIDSLGNWNGDPGSGWDVAGVTAATANHTLVRKSTVTSGNTSWAASAGTTPENSEWIVMDVDDFTFIGWHITPPSNGADILTFVLAEEIAPAMIDSESAQVTSTIAWNGDLTALVPEITVSEGATIVPASGTVTDFTSTVNYTVTAADGTTEKVWKVNVIKTPVLSIKEIQMPDGPVGDASPYLNQIVHTQGIVTGFDNYGFYLQDSAKTWSGIYVFAGSFKDSVLIGDKITIEGKVNEYYGLTQLLDVINVDVISHDNAIPTALVVTVPEIDEAYESVIVSTSDLTCVTTELYYGAWRVANGTDSLYIGTEIYSYSPTLGDAFVSISGIATFKRDFFRILPRSMDDIVRVLSTEADILTFVLAEQHSDAVIDATNHTVAIEVNEGTSVTALTPTITVSAGATVDPASGVSQDFTSAVTYTVTAEDGSTQAWTVTVTVYVGINDNNLAAVSIYPNPVNNSLVVANLEGVNQVMISNVLGQNLFTKNVNAVQMTINTAELQTGVYIVTLVSENGLTRSERIIKE